MTSCIVNIHLSDLEHDIVTGQSKTLKVGTIITNDITVDYKISLKMEAEQAKFYVCM